MVKKENYQHSANSLLKTASNKRLGAGRFALIALKGNPKPPLKKVKVPLPGTNNNNNPLDDRSKISDITPSVGEQSLLSRPALVKEVHHVAEDTDMESSVFDMSMNSDIISTDLDATKERQHTFKGPSTSLFPNLGTSVKTPFQPSNIAYQNHPSNKTVSASLSHPKGALVKRSTQINKGIMFTAPSPMTLTRCQVQRGQERTAPESKEYMALEAEKRKQQQKLLEKQHQREAKRAVREELKKEFDREQGEGFEAQLDDFDTTADTATFKKKSLVKKILGKIRPKSPQKKHQQSNFDAGTLNRDEASAMARQAMLASKQRKAAGSTPSKQHMNMSTPIMGIGGLAAEAAVLSADFDAIDTSVPFPVNEILMQPRQDSISDLDASMRKAPVMEILMGGTPQARDDESVSTLGTPRVFEKLDNLLRDPNRDPPQIVPVDSLPPPFMVTSHDANPLIDQLESSDKSASAGTANVEMAGICHVVDGCIMDQPKKAIKDGSAINKEKDSTIDKQTKSQDEQPLDNEEEEDEEVDAIDFEKRIEKVDFLLGENPMFDQVKLSSQPPDGSTNSTLGRAIDEAIEKNVPQINNLELHKSLSPIAEVNEALSGVASPFSGRSDGENAKDNEDDVIDLTNIELTPSNFDNLMDIAASRLEMEEEEDRYAVHNETVSPRRLVVGHIVEGGLQNNGGGPIVEGVEVAAHKSAIEGATPKTRGGVKKGFFAGSGSSIGSNNFDIYEGVDGDVVVCSEDPKRFANGAEQNDAQNLTKTFSGNFSDGLFDLLPSDDNNNDKKQQLLSSSGELSDEAEDQAKKNESPRKKKAEARDPQPTENDKGNQQIETQDGNNTAMEVKQNQNFLDCIIPCGGQPKPLIPQEAEKKKKQDRNLGFMCGAIPLYFMHAESKEEATSQKGELVAASEKADLIKEWSNELKVDSEQNIAKKERKRKDPEESYKKYHAERLEPRVLPPGNARKNALEQDAENGKFLLDKDDAYWDTLSTIASTTRDKSSDSDKYMYEIPRPGPIPIEITMSNKDADDKRNGSSAHEVIDLVDNEQVETPIRQSPRKMTQLLDTEADSGSKGSRVADLVAVFEKSNSSTLSTKETPGEGGSLSSTEGSGLLRDVTRSESNGDEKKESKTVPSDSPRKSSKEEEPSTPKPNFPSTSSHKSKSSEKPCPEMLMDRSRKSKQTAKSARSVTWGFEEVYESPEQIGRSSSTESGGNAILSAIAAAAAGSAFSRSLEKKSETGDSESLTDEEEKNLLTRTLELTKGLLGAMGNPDDDQEEKEPISAPLKNPPATVSEPEEKQRSAFADFFNHDKEQKEPISAPLKNPPATVSEPEEKQRSAFADFFNHDKEQKEPISAPLKNPPAMVSEPEEKQRSAFADFFNHDKEQKEAISEPLKNPPATVLEPEEKQRSAFADFFDQIPPFSMSFGQSPQGNGTSQTPIDVENLFSKYDNLAENLLEQNSKLKEQTGAKSLDQENKGSVGNYTSSSTSSQSPIIRSKLEMLRMQRAQALQRFQIKSNKSTSEMMSTGRDRDRLKNYSNASKTQATGSADAHLQATEIQQQGSMTSDSSAASQKARDLRKQLNEALQASKEIKMSQEQLGNELRSFKNRYYMKSDAIEDYAFKALGGL